MGMGDMVIALPSEKPRADSESTDVRTALPRQSHLPPGRRAKVDSTRQ